MNPLNLAISYGIISYQIDLGHTHGVRLDMKRYTNNIASYGRQMAAKSLIPLQREIRATLRQFYITTTCDAKADPRQIDITYTYTYIGTHTHDRTSTRVQQHIYSLSLAFSLPPVSLHFPLLHSLIDSEHLTVTLIPRLNDQSLFFRTTDKI